MQYSDVCTFAVLTMPHYQSHTQQDLLRGNYYCLGLSCDGSNVNHSITHSVLQNNSHFNCDTQMASLLLIESSEVRVIFKRHS